MQQLVFVKVLKMNNDMISRHAKKKKKKMNTQKKNDNDKK